jgi:hypothetical protein
MIERRRHEKKIMRRRPHPHACPACMVAARRYVEEYINSPRARDFPRKVEEAKHLIPQATPPLPSLTSPPLPFVAFPFPLLRASIFSGYPRSPIFNPPPPPPPPAAAAAPTTTNPVAPRPRVGCGEIGQGTRRAKGKPLE